MDYSKLTPEQLLELLKIQSPEMYKALSNPISNPGSFADGDMPLNDNDMFGYGEALQNILSRGYDPNLIVDEALSYPSDITDQNRILFKLGQTNTSLKGMPNEFPSDRLIGEDLNWYGDGPIPGDAAASAHYTFDSFSDEDLLKLILKQPANSGQIGAPEFTVDDSEPLFNFDPKEMIKRNKKFRWN